jgi:hypothetical protein
VARSGGSSGLSRIRAAVIGCAALALSVVATVVAVDAAAPADADTQAFIRDALQLSSSDLSSLNRGRAVVKTLSSPGPREMTTAGGIRIDGPAMAGFIEQFKTLQGFRRSKCVLQIARFSDVPQLGDLDALTMEKDDLDALRDCRAGDCDVQLTAGDIERFAREVDWRAPDANARAASVYKAILLDHVLGYRSAGMAALPVYGDDEEPVALADTLAGLMDARPSLVDRTPQFQSYLRHFPDNPPANTTDFFYWSKEAFGFKPVVGLNHVSVHAVPDSGIVMITTTQIYASHYLHGQFAVNALVPEPGAPTPTFYWLYVNRARIDRLSGILGAFMRPIIQSRARSGLEKSLQQTKERLEKRGTAEGAATSGDPDGGE